MIILVNMPFAPLQFPCLATGLIKAGLQASGLKCREFNLGFLLAETIGRYRYQKIASQRREIGEWLFAQTAWPHGVRLADSEFFMLTGIGDDSLQKQLLDLRTIMIPAFLDAAMERMMNCGPVDAVGFSCSYAQILSSFSMVRRIKSQNPQIKVVFGGSNFHEAMGRELMEKFNLIDAASLGEADDTVVPLFRSLVRGRDPAGLPGVCYRNYMGDVCQGPAYRPVSSQTLDRNAPPDFDDFFLDIENFCQSPEDNLRSTLYIAIETSRGCWKGEKLHCTFCGLNKKDIGFRIMGVQRCFEVIVSLLRRYRLKKVMLTDRIISNSFMNDLLPMLRHHPDAEGLTFWIESSTRLTHRQVRYLADAGVRQVQSGIESLSTSLLKCMRKGVTALKNVHFLKLCRTYGIYPIWTILLAIPGERQQDYDDMAALIPKLVHLNPPPAGVNFIRMHRFSPYFTDTGRWAENIRAPEYMRGLFPVDKVDISKVAFEFEADWKNILPGAHPYRQVIDRTRAWMDAWRLSPDLPGLEYEDLPDGVLKLLDSRIPGRKVTYELPPEEASVYRAIADPAAAVRLRRRFGGRDQRPVLERFIDQGIAIGENGRYLGLAIPAGAPVPKRDK